MNSCTFIGHKDCFDDIIHNLQISIDNLIIHNDVDTFYVWTNGNFDRLVYNLLIKLSIRYKIKIFVVLAYLGKSENYHYDPRFTLFPDILEKTPLKYAILKRNEYMLDKSQFLICYVNNTFSNSYSFVKKALCKKITIINLGSLLLK